MTAEGSPPLQPEIHAQPVVLCAAVQDMLPRHPWQLQFYLHQDNLPSIGGTNYGGRRAWRLEGRILLLATDAGRAKSGNLSHLVT